MSLTYVPLLQKQLELYTLPRGTERFQSYLKTMVNETGDAIDVAPLMAMNPMGKAHCNALLEAYLAPEIDAERLAEETLAELPTDAALRVSLVLVDDAKGGWTNRTDYEYKLRTQLAATLRRLGWLSVMLWTSGTPSAEAVVEATRTTLHRALHVLTHGDPTTLREVLQHEAAAQTQFPTLDPEELAYTCEILTPLLDTPTANMPVVVAALFGDSAATSLGYPPLGLSDNAGLALATQGSLV
ncbi:hypothetical protein [Armatimonas rosea]|uniref:Uncharacterized protein n=1 Tax=Armatimonas rosea TaxID=685828 RepID=A0A7W9SSH8_ARMRO|nr:hypothetical protein [Armatimonas rosea]MBB6051369.1 hypothetical protein [Armatimonas rosea]